MLHVFATEELGEVSVLKFSSWDAYERVCLSSEGQYYRLFNKQENQYTQMDMVRCYLSKTCKETQQSDSQAANTMQRA